ncbi:MAG: hypothetical protein LBS64_05050 [Spirochaetaceae bacterium]|jgi:hypothetical protein|nr:hypothetical protein [Spirochaetaceae bacterium]
MEKDFLENETLKLLSLLGREQIALGNVLEAQAQIRRSVREKDWGTLEATLRDFADSGEVFNSLENKRTILCRAICGNETGNDMFSVIRHVPERNREALLAAFTRVRSLLAESRVENSALGGYLKSCLSFLRGIFESVIPNRKGKVYTRAGTIIQSQPDRLIFDAVL